MLGLPICPRCKEEQEQKFQEVREYVREHRGADIMEVSDVCNVEPAQIRQWIREDRLQFADDSPIRIPCEKCGTMIRSGRFCDKCNAELINGFNQVIHVDKHKIEPNTIKRNSDRDRMRFL